MVSETRLEVLDCLMAGSPYLQHYRLLLQAQHRDKVVQRERGKNLVQRIVPIQRLIPFALSFANGLSI